MNHWYEVEQYRKQLLREAETERLIRTIRTGNTLRDLPNGIRRRLTALKNER